jgi:hypothetical protein
MAPRTVDAMETLQTEPTLSRPWAAPKKTWPAPPESSYSRPRTPAASSISCTSPVITARYAASAT